MPNKRLPSTRSDIHKYHSGKFNDAAKKIFLEAFRKTGRVTESAHKAGVSYYTIRDHKDKDPYFKCLYSEAYQEYCDSIRKEVHRRGVEGVDKPVFYKGVVVGKVREYSDRMLELEAKRHMPEYRDKIDVDVEATGGVLVVPGMSQSTAAWEKKHRGNDVTDVADESEKDGGRTLDRG